MKRCVLFIGMILLLVSLTGCFEQLTEIVVEQDGHGYIYVAKYMNVQMPGFTENLRGVLPSGEDAEGASDTNFQLSEDDFKKEAAEFGEGVRLLWVKDKKNKKGWTGKLAKYEFDDINKITINALEKPAGMVGEEAEVPNEVKQPVTFTYIPGDTNTLTISMPEWKMGEAETGGPDGDKKEDLQQQALAMQMMKPMFDGLRILVRVRVAGDVVENSATHKSDEDKLTTLAEIRLGDVMADMANFTKFQGLQALKEPEEVKKAVTQIKGLTLEVQEQVTVKFQ